MDVNQWRNKHRKCKYCQFAEHCIMMGDNQVWCKAKLSVKQDNAPRYFCECFKVRNKG